ncbi:aminomuconate-semialdehyde/2-hydroxymuconate-6-semialdehyde dehydrogenase [Hymenobacter luteus]|uniref:Aminomuconate-semialdehyde/2-hydroxymuconate-6-semialdehyde dehydrogenase n=2 Tax=Hymenobacter TaxID=89966 RepID=A0A7W9WD21_9BACT|nr:MULTISPECIES: aldehyde dehydrogenase [Hymenobacter]MBB4603212.1 aminomuconate-semialdehyde/2-hydroxymuconate-6-semialdehyde dehydrogenase [Hymenobacter latericoloratus]MBB6060110.1 aminomuconate-semialdehyde/2-hydroxymuconate-6-semialdehyde dehydrogenase [Hymenobacter luteus]
MLQLHNFIGGEFLPPASGSYLPVVNPATGQVFGQVADSGPADIDRAVQAATAALPGWRALPPEERGRRLVKLAELIDRDLETLARAESEDNGKPLALARTLDIPRAASNFAFFGTAAQHFATEAHVQEGLALNYTVRHPVGVVACISPWNLPLYLFTWKIAPALAAGCCVVAKPSELTPYTAYLLSELSREAGLPPGVLNIVHGSGPGAGQALVEHPGIRAISFTRGTATGARIARTAAPQFKKLSLELGGKNPNLLFADCDLAEAVQTSIRSSFANQGQICLCGSRIFVERPIYEAFKAAFLAQVRELTVGDPLEATTRQGAIVSEAHLRKILSYIELAHQAGGQLLAGGRQVQVPGRCTNGYFLEPTVFEGLAPDCRVNQEEIFGPVVTLTPFDTEEEVVAWANGTDYGLSATLWTRDLTRAHRVAQQLQAGVVWVNTWLHRDLRTPFGGMKNSGVGREGGLEALRFFTEAQNVCVKL